MAWARDVSRALEQRRQVEMILLGFVLFALLVIAWLAAPTTGEEAVKTQAPALKMSKSPAD
jgi:hypothetical protein